MSAQNDRRIFEDSRRQLQITALRYAAMNPESEGKANVYDQLDLWKAR